MAEIPKEALKFKGPTREKVRRAIVRVLEAEEIRASTKIISIARLRGAGCGDQNAATELLRCWRAGTLSAADPWDAVEPPPRDEGGPSPLAELERRVRAAGSDGEREAVALEVAALLAGGRLDAETASAIKGLITEARQSADAKRETEPAPEDPRKLLLASPEAMSAARAIDWIVDDARRDRVLAFVAAELEADRVQHPNTDEGGVT